MPSRYWDHIANLVAGQTARAGNVNATFEQVDGAMDLVAQEMNRTIRFTDANPGQTDFQLAHTALQRANKILGFNASGGPELRGGTFTWRGNWATLTAYSVNDVVRAPATAPFYNSLYVCLTAHTSDGTNFASDVALSRWALMVDLTDLYLAVPRFQIVTTSQLIAAGGDYYVDVSAGAITLNLPATPTINDQPIRICHIGGTIQTNNLTIGRNGNRIMGLLEDLTVNTPNATFELGYSDAARGWRLIRGV